MDLLKSNAEPFIDTPNSVLRRLLGLSPSANGNRPITTHEMHGAESPSPRRTRKSRSKARQGRKSAPRAVTGTILPDDEYELPILSILDSNGGRAPTREVLDELGQRLNGRLLPADHEKIGSGDVRWRNRAQFVRLRLIDRGDMVKGSPRGLWEITEQGRDKLVAQ